MELTKEKYSEMVGRVSPKSHLLTDCTGAFITGGLFCCAGQLISDIYKMIGFSVDDIYKMIGFSEDEVSALTSISLIFIGTALTFLGVYGKLAKIAGAGTLVPITGFANAVASPAMEFKSEGLIHGTGAKMFDIAGPVIVYGTFASVIYGIIFYLTGIG